ncbi:MAG: hypothetical protein ACOZAN_04490 [Patescibacteria group bacterium]
MTIEIPLSPKTFKILVTTSLLVLVSGVAVFAKMQSTKQQTALLDSQKQTNLLMQDEQNEQATDLDLSAAEATPTASPIPTLEPTAVPTSMPTNTPVPAPKISLTGKATDSGISFSWTVNGIDSNLGFKLVKSTESNPTYPGSDYKYLSEPSQRSYTWDIRDGKTYHFRVCRYIGEKCDVYSNDITVTAPSAATSENKNTSTGSVTSISLSGSGSSVSWSANGRSEKGFKVVWSKNSDPTYPTRSGDKFHYYSDPNKSNDQLEAFDGAGKYYVRVCEYLGGRCGVYSNQLTLDL